jgi:hypothetical protein
MFISNCVVPIKKIGVNTQLWPRGRRASEQDPGQSEGNNKDAHTIECSYTNKQCGGGKANTTIESVRLNGVD